MRRATWTLAVLLLGMGGIGFGCTPEPSDRGERAAPAEHDVVVLTRLVGPRVHYFEGALVHVRLEPADSSAGTGVTPESWGPEQVGRRGRWSGVVDGEWRLVGSTRVCSGNCGELSGPVDECDLDLDLVSDRTVVVTYRWGEPCSIEVP